MAKARKPGDMIVEAQKPEKRIAVSFQSQTLQSWTLLLLIPVVIGYFISARTYANNHIHIVDISSYADTSAQMPVTRITSARGEVINFGIYLGVEDKTPWASPSGFRLALNGLEKPLQLIEPSQPHWAAPTI